MVVDSPKILTSLYQPSCEQTGQMIMLNFYRDTALARGKAPVRNQILLFQRQFSERPEDNGNALVVVVYSSASIILALLYKMLTHIFGLCHCENHGSSSGIHSCAWLSSQHLHISLIQNYSQRFGTKKRF